MWGQPHEGSSPFARTITKMRGPGFRPGLFCCSGSERARGGFGMGPVGDTVQHRVFWLSNVELTTSRGDSERMQAPPSFCRNLASCTPEKRDNEKGRYMPCLRMLPPFVAPSGGTSPGAGCSIPSKIRSKSPELADESTFDSQVERRRTLSARPRVPSKGCRKRFTIVSYHTVPRRGALARSDSSAAALPTGSCPASAGCG